MKLVYKYMAIFLNLRPTSTHLHLLQVENCGSNSRLVVDEGNFVLERVNPFLAKLSFLNFRPIEVVTKHLMLKHTFHYNNNDPIGC